MAREEIETRPCRICKCSFSILTSKCPECGAWHSKVESDDDDGTILLSQVGKVEETPRISVGPWNAALNGGLSETGVYLIGGGPGAGKSTLALQMADIIAGSYRDQERGEVMYVGAEETPKEIAARFTRLRCKNFDRIRVLPIDKLPNFSTAIPKHKPIALFLDSLQGLTEDLEEGKKICRQLKPWAIELKAPMVVIGQVTKTLDFAGLMSMQHAVDATYSLQDEVGDEQNPVRTWRAVKDRYGAAPFERYFLMGERGLSFIGDAEALQDHLEGPRKARRRKPA